MLTILHVLRLGVRKTVIGAVGALALAATPGVALAGNWSPTEAKVLIASTNFKIVIGSTEDICAGWAGEGTLGKATTWTFTPSFTECTKKITTAGAWTATDVNAKEATIKLPKGETALSLEFSKECKAIIEEAPTLGAEGDYTNGKNGDETPSALALAEHEATVKQIPAGCVGSTKAKISANTLLLNMTSMTSAIEVS